MLLCASCQFYQCTVQTAWLGKRLVFGSVVEGMNVVKAIEVSAHWLTRPPYGRDPAHDIGHRRRLVWRAHTEAAGDAEPGAGKVAV